MTDLPPEDTHDLDMLLARKFGPQLRIVDSAQKPLQFRPAPPSADSESVAGIALAKTKSNSPEPSEWRFLLKVAIWTALLLALAWLSPSLIRPAHAQDLLATVDARLAVVARYEKACRYSFASQPKLFRDLLKAGGGSVSEVCECAAMLSVSALGDEELADTSEETLSKRTAALGANVATCSTLSTH